MELCAERSSSSLGSVVLVFSLVTSSNSVLISFHTLRVHSTSLTKSTPNLEVWFRSPLHIHEERLSTVD